MNKNMLRIWLKSGIEHVFDNVVISETHSIVPVGNGVLIRFVDSTGEAVTYNFSEVISISYKELDDGS